MQFMYMYLVSLLFLIFILVSYVIVDCFVIIVLQKGVDKLDEIFNMDDVFIDDELVNFFIILLDIFFRMGKFVSFLVMDESQESRLERIS